jgi:hypothetical protein
MENPQPRFLPLAAKTVVCHTLTYMFMGVLAKKFLNYGTEFARTNSGMRLITDPWVMAGQLFQPLRGLVFASVFYLLRGCLFGKKNGWFLMAWMLIALGILSTFGPVAGSLEGMVYTTAPIRSQITGWLEIVPQAVLLSALLCYWVNHPEKKWLNWVLGILFFIAMSLPVLGLLLRKA